MDQFHFHRFAMDIQSENQESGKLSSNFKASMHGCTNLKHIKKDKNYDFLLEKLKF